MSLLITGARVIDPNGERRVDVRLDGGTIAEVADQLVPSDGDRISRENASDSTAITPIGWMMAHRYPPGERP